MTGQSQLRIESGTWIDWIIFDRPDAANAFSATLLNAFSDALTTLAETGAPVIGIRGEGKGFSSGADLSEYAIGTPVEDVARLRRNLDSWQAMWRHPKPVIVAIHGFCLGIAAQMPCFADMTIVAEDARIGEPGIPLGGGYIAPAWVSQVGAKRAKELAFLPGNYVDGKTAVEWGWANAAVPADRLIECVEALAERMAKIPLPVLTMKKRSINRAMEAGGFLTAVNAVSESDAILHFEPSVLELRERLAKEGLRETLAQFRGESSTEIFIRFKGDSADG
ncbi:enoyl-CoA hydratase/isomerase family protein [Sphingorhabdus sp.]|jgi:enoyl-CoA hydratase|uniref:enoyl-CoA hydratase/isomerase family protein n=1 Tax=Sphingorhabdus sp. TaxID=1902408 RepID=UPI0037C74FE7